QSLSLLVSPSLADAVQLAKEEFPRVLAIILFLVLRPQTSVALKLDQQLKQQPLRTGLCFHRSIGQSCDDRVGLAEPPAPAADLDRHGFVERGAQERGEARAAGPPARIAGAAFGKTAMRRRLAIADRIISYSVGHRVPLMRSP